MSVGVTEQAWRELIGQALELSTSPGRAPKKMAWALKVLKGRQCPLLGPADQFQWSGFRWICEAYVRAAVEKRLRLAPAMAALAHVCLDDLDPPPAAEAEAATPYWVDK